MNTTGTSKYTDSRRHPRCKLEMLVGVIRNGKFGFEYSLQIGEGGMLLELFSPAKLGEQIEVSFFMPPKGELILVKGEVVYCLEPVAGRCLVGVRFTNATAAIQSLIRKFVEVNIEPPTNN